MLSARNLPLLVWRAENGFLAECPLLPGHRAPGSSRDEALAQCARLLEALFAERPEVLDELPEEYEVVHVPTRTFRPPAALKRVLDARAAVASRR